MKEERKMKDDRVGGSRQVGERHVERERERDGGEREIKDGRWRKEQSRRESERGV